VLRARLAFGVMEGRGLHTGRPCAVRFERTDGPTTLGRGADRATLASMRVEGRDRCSFAILPSGREIATVEHLLSAIVGASVFRGLHVEIDGDEVPLLDGGSARFFDGLAQFVSDGPDAIVTRAAIFESSDTVLSIAPCDLTEIVVHVDYAAARFGRELRGTARWNGDRATYRAAIATARTFGAASELAALRARGLASHVPEGSVVALDVDDPRFAPSDPSEPIRHKLLDALGDLATLGGILRGRVEITRPSHRGTRGAVGLALGRGAIVTVRE